MKHEHIIIAGPKVWPAASTPVYRRLKTMKRDFPDTHFTVVTGATGAAVAAAIRAARLLSMSLRLCVVGDLAERFLQMIEGSRRMFSWWEEGDAETEGLIHEAHYHGVWLEVYEMDGTPAGARSAKVLTLR